jgi:tetratricopeptide (TPR) repeat protein
LATCREVDDRNGVAIAAGNLGTVYQRLGQYEESLEHHRQALATYRATGNRAGQASTLTNTAIVDGRLGHHEAALDRYREALAIFTDLGDREHVAETRAGVIHSLYALGRADEASGILTEALHEYGAAASSGLTAGTLNRFAEAMAIAGRIALAVEWHEAALVLARSIEDRYETARAFDGLARLDSAAGRTDEARRHWHEALSLYGDLGVPEADAVRETLDNLVSPAQSP